MKKSRLLITAVTGVMLSVNLFVYASGDTTGITNQTEYIVNYDFEASETGGLEKVAQGNVPSPGIYFVGGTTSSNLGSNAEIITEDGSSNKVLKITKDSSTRPAGAQIKLNSALKTGVYEYTFDLKLVNHSTRFDQNTFGSTSGYFDYTYMSHSGTYCSRGFANYGSTLQLADTTVSGYSQNSTAEWEKVRVIIDLDSNKTVYYFGDEFVAAKTTGPAADPNQNILYLNFMPTYFSGQNGTASGDGIYYVDNIRLKAITNSVKTVEPEKNSVDVPQSTKVTAEFEYPVTGSDDVTVTANGVPFTAGEDYTVTWNADSTAFEISFARDIPKSKEYEVKLGDMLITCFATEKIPFGAENIKAFNEDSKEIKSLAEAKGKSITINADIVNNYGVETKYTAIAVLVSPDENMCDISFVRDAVPAEAGKNTQNKSFSIKVPDAADLSGYSLRLFAVDKFDVNANVLILPCEVFE